MKKKIWVMLAIGIVVRLFLAFSTYHSDVQPFSFAGSVLAKGNIANFYDYLWDLPESAPILKVYPRNLFNYPPAVYFVLGFFSIITTWPLGAWFNEMFILDVVSLLGDLRLNMLLLLLKFPYLLVDIPIAFILMRFFKEQKQKLLVFGFWMFNPVNLYATYMMGTFDVIPTFLTVATLGMVYKKREGISSSKLIIESILLGLGGAFKIFPLIFLVPLASLKTKWLDRIRIVVIGVGVYVATILPFIGSKGFRMTALLAGQTTKSLYASIPISGGEGIMLYLAFTLFFFILFMQKKATAQSLWRRFFMVLLVFFVFTHYHPQYFLWLTPFLIIDLVKSKMKRWYIVVLALVSFVGLVTFFDSGLTVWLFSPLFPNLYGLPGVWNLVGVNFDLNSSRSFLHTIFVGVAMYWTYDYLCYKQQ